jgi:hypothetical protein
MAGHRFQGRRLLRPALSTDVDHDDNVLTSQGEYRPIERCGASIGTLHPRLRAALLQSSGMSCVVAIPMLSPAPQPR